MRNIILVLILSFIYSPMALAGKNKFFLNSRFDYVNAETDFAKTGENPYEAFQATDARLDFRGDFTEKLQYRFQANFRKGFTVSDVDKTPPFLEIATISHKFADNFELIVGKQLVAIGSWEFDYISSDIYRFSLVGNSVPFFEVGATLYYTVGAHKFGIQSTNSDRSGTNGKRTNSLSRSIIWYGKFLDGMIAPIVSYNEFPQWDQRVVDKFLAAGSQYTFGRLVVDTDVVASRTQESNGIVDNLSLIGQFVYKWAHFRPYLKIIVDSSKVEGVKQYDGLGVDIALQYYPYEDQNFRYHIAYSKYDTTAHVNTEVSKSTHVIFAGIRFHLDLLQL